jgi:hypothetical protein
MAHWGLLSVAAGEPAIRAEVDFVDGELVVAAASGRLGSWPLAHCRVEPKDNQFLIIVDDEQAWFRADQPGEFARAALAMGLAPGLASAVQAAREAAGSAPMASEEAAAAEEEPPKPVWLATIGDRTSVLVVAGIVLAGVLLGLVAGLGRPPQNPNLGTVPTTTSQPPPTIFDLTLEEVSIRWNQTASSLRVQLFIAGVPATNRMEVDLGSGLTLYATEDPRTGTLHSMMISTGPTTGAQAQAVLAAWGTLVAVADADLSPAARREILSRLGVDVNRPLLMGLKTETTEGPVRYWLRSGVLGERVLLGIAPAP